MKTVSTGEALLSLALRLRLGMVTIARSTLTVVSTSKVSETQSFVNWHLKADCDK